jgi:TatD DNase family protein
VKDNVGQYASGLIDTHCHLDFEQFDSDRDRVLELAAAAGVTKLINPGTDLPSNRRAVALAGRYDHVFAAVGIHPHEASTLDEETLDELRRLAANPKVVAIGEIGLDYYRDLSPRPQQRAAFDAQLALAAELSLPVIIHQREAAQDVMAALKQWCSHAPGGSSGVLHAFSGDLAMAKEAVALGFCIGVAGPVTFQNARRLPEIIPQLPVDHLLVETDAPYLTPHPYRGQRNEPSYLPLVARRVAELLGLPLDVLSRQVTDNASRLFSIPVQLPETTAGRPA